MNVDEMQVMRILLTDAEYDEFVARLAEPPKVLPKLAELLSRPTPFED